MSKYADFLYIYIFLKTHCGIRTGLSKIRPEKNTGNGRSTFSGWTTIKLFLNVHFKRNFYGGKNTKFGGNLSFFAINC
jgi:hypothetical protein